MFRSSFSLSTLFFFFVSVLSFNCTKIDNTNIGADLLPAVDNVNTFDTSIDVIANNFDSASTDCFTVFPADEHSLGYIQNDPLFGTTQSILYTELKPDVFPFQFPANSVLDSIVLVLSYSSSFGDTSVPQKVDVYQIANKFNPDTSSCTFYNYSQPALGSVIYTPYKLKDSITAFRELSANQLRIKLNNSFGQDLLSKDLSFYASDSLFIEKVFKGFAIVPDVNFGGSALNYFSLIDSNTKVSIYTRSGTDTSVINFRLSPLSASANYVTRNHTGAEIENHLGKPADGDELIYIQTTPGTSAEIKIPALTTLSNRIIHRAVLTMDEVYSDNPFENVFSTPNVLYLDYKDPALQKDTAFKPVPCDFNIASGTPNLSTFGGFRTIAKDAFGHNISRYTFNLSRYIQKIVTNKSSNVTFRLRAPYNIINLSQYFDECGQGVPFFNYPINLPTFGRVKLGGGNNQNYKMKLYIVYSNI